MKATKEEPVKQPDRRAKQLSFAFKNFGNP
jgi:hypothetical protein